MQEKKVRLEIERMIKKKQPKVSKNLITLCNFYKSKIRD